MDQIVGLKSSSHAELPPPPKIFAEGRRPFQWNLCLGLRYKQLSFQSSQKNLFFFFPEDDDTRLVVLRYSFNSFLFANCSIVMNP